jgi:large subunit ribosomal protein L24
MAKKKKKALAAGKATGMKIKKGDDVVVIAGRDRGREGKVIMAYPDTQRVLVHGVNIIRKNTKVNFQGQRGAKEGGIVTQEGPIHVSNVALVHPDTKKPVRAGYRLGDDNSKTRVARPDGKEI